MLAEYIWIDGGRPTARVRSKTRVLPDGAGSGVFSDVARLGDLPEWSFDGSSTEQASGDRSDCVLKPVRVIHDPIRGGHHVLVLCEVMNADGSPHVSNTRADLRLLLEESPSLDTWAGFEQEYTLFDGSKPLGFPSERRFPPAQGPYYCGVGADEVAGRDLVEEHLELSLKAGIPVTGINAEVMPGQWEFQVGGPNIDMLEASDYVWLARWLLYRVGEGYGISATLDPKPVPGDWNGAGMHTNFSTAQTRGEGGMEAIEKILNTMRDRVSEHLSAYGDGYEIRLTGKHETCRYDDFRWGVSDRTASVRIPLQTNREGKGYFEDRRPNANADPYRVSCELVRSTVLALG
jgi:glutamine synthetase